MNQHHLNRTGQKVELTTEQKQQFKESVKGISNRVEALLPHSFSVAFSVEKTPNGPTGMVTIQPPIGQAVGTGIQSHEFDSDNEILIDEDGEKDIALILTATMVIQAQQNMEWNSSQISAS